MISWKAASRSSVPWLQLWTNAPPILSVSHGKQLVILAASSRIESFSSLSLA